MESTARRYGLGWTVSGWCLCAFFLLLAAGAKGTSSFGVAGSVAAGLLSAPPIPRLVRRTFPPLPFGSLTAVAFLVLAGSVLAERTASVARFNASPEQVQAEVDGLWLQASRATAPCDEGLAAVAQESGAGLSGSSSRTRAYMSAAIAEGHCKAAGDALKAIKPSPLLNGEVRRSVVSALDTCVEAYEAKRVSANGMAHVLNGPTRPSDVAGMGARTSDVTEKARNCSALFAYARRTASNRTKSRPAASWTHSIGPGVGPS